MPSNITQGFAPLIAISNATEIIYTGMTHVETSRIANTVKMVVTTISVRITIIITTTITTTIIIITTAPKTLINNAVVTTYTGTIHAETSRDKASIVLEDVITTHAVHIIKIISTTSIILIHTGIVHTTHTSFVQEATFIGMTHVETSRTYFRPAMAQIWFANMDSALISNQHYHQYCPQ